VFTIWIRRVALRRLLIIRGGVIPSAAVFQAERGISRAPSCALPARFLAPLVKTRVFGMTQQSMRLPACLYVVPVLVCRGMSRPPDRRLLSCLAAYDPHVSDLTLALRELVLEEAPAAIESIVKSYAVAIGFSFTGKPLKDGFCHIVTYPTHVNLGFNRGALLPDPNRILIGKGKSIRHMTIRNHSELENPVVRRFLQAAIEQVNAAPAQTNSGRNARTSAKRGQRSRKR
jgi:hypothetical protein